jgi:hypothetical protein
VVRLFVAALVCAVSVYAADTENSVRKSVPVSSASRLTLRAEVGSIVVQSGAADHVDVEAWFRGTPPSKTELNRMLHDFRLDVAQQGSEVRVSATFTGGWEPMLSFMIFDSPFFGNAICHNWRCLVYSRWLDHIEYRVSVPGRFGADVSTSGGSISIGNLKGEVTAHTSGGALNFDHIEGSLNASTSGGSIRVVDIAGDVDVHTSGGGISIDGASGHVKAHTSGGRINAVNITGAIDASSSGGSVTASLLAQPKHECRFYTSGGSINLSLPRDARVNLDASTSGGTVSTDFPVPFDHDRRERELRTPLNGGGPLLYLHTSGGGIRIRRTG